MSTEPPIAVVGAGLVGTTAAIYLAREGYNVHLYEGRDDLRLEAKHDESSPFGASTSPTARSINLALSKRGIDTFDAIGLKDIVLSNVIQMKCRAMHAFDGSLSYMPYGTGSQHINSVSRNFLNHLLLDEAEKLPNVTIFFNAKVTRVSKAGVLTVDFKKAGQTKRVPTRLVIGADGAFSSVRSSMMRLMRVDFSQHFIEHGYKELTMPPVRRPDGSMGYAIDPVNALHIWPRHEYMMIALPNPDKSFTCTVFAPFAILEGLDKHPEQVEEWFAAQFPDAVPAIPDLLAQYKANPTGALVTVHVAPWHYEDKVVIMGDAAHALVPFYGQGMNAGLEDVFTFYKVLKSCGGDLSRAVPEWARARKPAGDAIAQLSYDNYVEMRSHTASRSFLLQKRFEARLHQWFPDWWIPLYTMVAFTNIPYDEVIRREAKQSKILKRTFNLGSLLLVAGVAAAGFFGYRRISKL